MNRTKKRIILHAGDYCFDTGGAELHTLLGSCVSITLWHPELKIGGMCHFALPTNLDAPVLYRGVSKLNPRFADDCMALFARSAKRHRTQLREYHAKIFGGGNMYPKTVTSTQNSENRVPIGEKNVAAAYELLTQAGVDVLVAHVGEFGYRKIIFDSGTGDVWVKFKAVKKVGNQDALTGLS